MPMDVSADSLQTALALIAANPKLFTKPFFFLSFFLSFLTFRTLLVYHKGFFQHPNLKAILLAMDLSYQTPLYFAPPAVSIDDRII